MRTAGLFSPATLLSLHILSANAEPICRYDHSLATLSVTHLSSLQAALEGSVTKLCNRFSNAKGNAVIAHKAEGVTFQITQGATQSIEECRTSFAAIIAQCVGSKNLDGGEVIGMDGVTYQVYHDDDFVKERDVQEDEDDLKGSRNLEARAGKPPKSPMKPPPKTPAKEDPKSLPIGKPKPAPVMPKPSPTPSSSNNATPTKSCKQIYEVAFADVVAEDSELQKEERQLDSAEAVARRDFYVGSMTGLSSMMNLDKRTKKEGKGCGFNKFTALDYPEPAKMSAKAKFYHFTDPTACEALDFTGTTKEAKGLTRANYQVEHILEWQVVTKFFDWVQTKKGNEKFDNPDPSKTNKLAFCPYWRATWEGANSPVFKLKPEDKMEMNAIDHIRYAYPGKGNFEDEFVWLQTAVNSPAKSQMWAYKKGEDIIYGDRTKHKPGGKNKPGRVSTGMTDLIVGTEKATRIPQARPTVDSARQAYFKLKWILGARKYLKDPEVKAIFKKQKERIGDVLGALDIAMEKQPKTTTTGTVMKPWKRQGLKALWDEYMDEKFAAAKKRSDNDMDKYLRLLEGKWALQKDVDAKENDRVVFFAQIRKLKAAWVDEKKTWTAPWK